MNQIISFSIIIIFIVTGILLIVYTGNSKDNFTPVPSSQPLYNWRVNDSSGIGIGISYGNKRWVAVGEAIKYSEDGENWTNSNNAFNNGIGIGVAYGNERWVAVGYEDEYEAIKYSEDGKKWENDSNEFNNGIGIGVAYGNRLWVAVGESDTTIKYSENGDKWENDANNDFEKAGHGVAYGNGLWVAVGNDNDEFEDITNTTIKYSEDGKNWINASNDFSLKGNDVAYGNGLWVAVGNDHKKGTIKYSKDGANWINASNAFDGKGYGVAYDGNGLWVAVGENEGTGSDDGPKIKYSEDGQNWTNLIIPKPDNITINNMYGLAFSDEKLIITGNFNNTKSFLIADLSPTPTPTPITTTPPEQCHIPKQNSDEYIYSTEQVINGYQMIIKIPGNMLDFTLENNNFKFMFDTKEGSLRINGNNINYPDLDFVVEEDINIIDDWKPITDIFTDIVDIIDSDYIFSYNNHTCNNEINNNETILNNVKYAWKIVT